MTSSNSQCPNAATCPSVHECGHALDGPGYLIVGKTDTALHAEHHDGNVADDETPVWVPKEVIDDAITRPLKARIRELERDAAWREPEAINTATGAPHCVTLADDGSFTIRHNLGCHRNGGRRETRTGELICQLDSYLDQTDDDGRSKPGDYWVIVDVFGRSEEPVEAEWVPADGIAALEAERARVRAVLDEIEQKALAEEKSGYAIAYCALWDAHGLLDDALNGTGAADTTSSEEPKP